jgi:hypothetical protein
MRDLIKAIIREEVKKFDTLKLIRDYKGSNVFMNSVKNQLAKTGTLTANQIDGAVRIFKTNFYKDSLIYDSLQKHYQSNMKVLGIEAYLNLMTTPKKDFLKPSKDYKIIVDKPSQEWVDRNLNDLMFFIANTKNSPNSHKFEDRKNQLTTHEEALKLMSELTTEKFVGFVELDGDKKTWSILNKINTNTINWSKMITKRYLNGDLGEGSALKVLEKYFKQQSISHFYHLDKHKKNIVSNSVKTLSFAEFDIIEAFHHQNDEDTEMLGIDPLSNIINRIEKTTKSGDKSEDDFIKWLIINKNVPQSKIHSFSSYGNLVDITFQTDLILDLNGIVENGVKTPIQVKSSEVSTKLLNYDIGGIMVFPTKGTEQKINYGDWLYKAKGGIAKSFEKDFFPSI